MLRPFIAIAALCFFPLVIFPRPVAAGCQCRCVESSERAVCDSPRDMVPICGRNSCPIAPASSKPADTHRAPPVGTYGCDWMREYDWTFRRYAWTELCESSSRSNIALIRPGSYIPPGGNRGRRTYLAPPAAAGMACDTDSDCPNGTKCSRRSTNESWQCMRR
jgi:hypothetical protein